VNRHETDQPNPGAHLGGAPRGDDRCRHRH
jgi:hypothetical protein